MMKELGFGTQFEHVPVNIDNTATFHHIASSVQTKRVALRSSYVQEFANDGAVSIHHILTVNQLADNCRNFGRSGEFAS